MTLPLARGALIVLEGVDKTGKSSQCRQLVQNLQGRGIKSELWGFPDRATILGRLIDNYLQKQITIEDRVIHLLFSANRWENVPRIKNRLNSGITLVVDRYAFSGVAFSAAKNGMNVDWCRSSDVGLPQPDLVFYLSLDPKVSAARANFGDERYEQTEFQTKVKYNFDQIRENSWKIVQADQNFKDIELKILQMSLESIEDCKFKPLNLLWS